MSFKVLQKTLPKGRENRLIKLLFDVRYANKAKSSIQCSWLFTH